MIEATPRSKYFLPTTLLWLAAAITTILAACGGYSSGNSASTMGCGGAYGTAPCAAPSVTLSDPGTTVNRTVKLTATASAAGTLTVTRVEFLIDGTSVGTVSTAPYNMSWDSTTVGDGNHMLTARVTDSQGQTATTPADGIQVENNPTFTVAMASAQMFPAPSSSATGTANLMAKLGSGALSGKVTLNGVTATAVSINEAFAGAAGASVVTLAASATTAGEWDVPAAAVLTADQLDALLQGKLYVIALSAAEPSGEIRGQITPASITVIFAAMDGTQEVPGVAISAVGVAAITVDSTANTLTAEVNTTGVDDATAAAVDTAAAGATGPKLTALTRDSVNMGLWATELTAIAASDVSNFKANKWYVNVSTPSEPNGAIRGQIDATSTPPPPPPAAPTLTQLNVSVFSHCVGCHTGGGSTLPSSMDLTPGHAYASIVNVASVEQPGLKRVAPGDPDNSYVVQKLEGASTISGARMPFGGPYLDQATIDQLRAWISAGALNN